MKNVPTPVPYPTTKEEAEKWGFDIWEPKGTPLAWVLDWESAEAGSGVQADRLTEIREFRVEDDLSQLTIDDLGATCSDKMRHLWNNSVRVHEKMHGEPSTIEYVQAVGSLYGPNVWRFLKQKWGSPVPLRGLAWYQDFVHMQYGPSSKPYTWFDEEKVVCTRLHCRLRPPKGLESNVKYCLAYDDAVLETYMENEPTLFSFMGPHMDEKAQGRCVHIWTYDKSIVDNMPDTVRPFLRETVKKVLRDKGANI
jgi:hypothetical protein